MSDVVARLRNAPKSGPSLWEGFGGDDHIAGAGEWQALLRKVRFAMLASKEWCHHIHHRKE